MSDLLNPDIPALVEKWKHVLDVVLPLNKWDTDREIAWLCEAASQSSDILELGSYAGVSTKAMAMANPIARIYCIDLWEEPETKVKFRELLQAEISEFRVGSAQCRTDVGLAWLSTQKTRFDFAFIDGGHTEICVRGDIQGTLPLMNPRSLLSGHDFRRDNPADGLVRAVNEAFPGRSLPVDSIWCVEVA